MACRKTKIFKALTGHQDAKMTAEAISGTDSAPIFQPSVILGPDRQRLAASHPLQIHADQAKGPWFGGRPMKRVPHWFVGSWNCSGLIVESMC